MQPNEREKNTQFWVEEEKTDEHTRSWGCENMMMIIIFERPSKTIHKFYHDREKGRRKKNMPGKMKKKNFWYIFFYKRELILVETEHRE